MSVDSKKIRLDQLLVRKGLISEEQVKEALLHQKAHGGKLGSQLLYHRYIDEAGLVKALATHFGCEGVVLSELEVPEPVIGFIPPKVAIARKVMPFGYSPDDNMLHVACEDPTDESLIDELHFVARGKNIKLFVAAELALNTSIARYYLRRDTSLDDNLLLEIPEEATETGKLPTPDSREADEAESSEQPAVLLVTDEEYSGPLLQSLLERDGFKVVVTDSADDAIDIIGETTYHSVLIKDSVTGDYIDLIDRLRKTSPRTTVRYYESASSLLLGQETVTAENQLLLPNLELFTSLLSLRERLTANHSGAVGQYAGRLCRQLGLPEKDRLLIANAGYIHDLARFYHHPDEGLDQQELIKLTRKLLASLHYSPVVVEILRNMYADLSGKYTRRLPIEVLGGNIVTTVDLFCETVDQNEKLSLDRFDAIKKRYRSLIGKMFLPEVVEAFLALIQDEILQSQSAEKPCQVMIYADNPGILSPIANRVRNEGFRTLSQCSLDSFVELYERSLPEIMILILHRGKDEIAVFVDDLERRSVAFDKVPTFLIVDGPSGGELTGLLNRGFEDVMSLEVNIDILIAKMGEIQAAIHEEERHLHKATHDGTHGRLADMNLTDLVQTLGSSRKTVRITVHGDETGGQSLVICLREGEIAFAQMGDLLGAEAVYEGLMWPEGSWTVEPVSPDAFSEPNNQLSNESILLEGCRRHDERVRSGQLL